MKSHYKIWIAVSLALVFGLGIAAGVFGERFVVHKKADQRRGERRPVHFPSLLKLADELGLTEDQQQRIREAFKKNEERLKTLRSQFESRLGEVRSTLKTELDTIMTDEQRREFEAMIEEYLRKRREQQPDRRRDAPPNDRSEPSDRRREPSANDRPRRPFEGETR